MELLIALPGAGAPARPRRSARFAVGMSLGVHAALIVAALALPAARPAAAPPPITVDIVAAEMPPEPPPPPTPPPRAAFVPARLTIPRRMTASAPPPAAPAPAAATPPEAPAEAPAPAAEAPLPAASDGPSVVAAPATTTSVGRGPAGGTGAGEGTGPSPAQRAALRTTMIGRYRDLLRTRVRDGFRYPEEARELELTGEVVLQVTIDRVGRLTGARVHGACPHPLLCAHALRTVRAAAPFAALPPDLGDTLQVELPLAYNFE